MAGMEKRQMSSMQHLVPWCNASGFGKADIGTSAVGCISDQWKAEVLEMNPNLVGAPSF